MATAARQSGSMTLEEFLLRPDEKPYHEYIDGRIEVKVSPEAKHGIIEYELTRSINRYCLPLGLGRAFIELRCTFTGRSIVPDVAFMRTEHVEIDAKGEYGSVYRIPPDIHVEILSPGQSAAATRKKLKHSTSHGSAIGWFIFPEDRKIEVYRGGELSMTLQIGDVLAAEPALPGFKLPVEEIFGWLKPS